MCVVISSQENIRLSFKVSSSVGRTNVTWWRGGEFAGEGEDEIKNIFH